eukprot:scaffold878_cov271-Pinguiococcus_pyrenoidosus.AAC.4
MNLFKAARALLASELSSWANIWSSPAGRRTRTSGLRRKESKMPLMNDGLPWHCSYSKSESSFALLLHWSYGGPGRFKGRHDAAGGSLKRFWKALEMKPEGESRRCEDLTTAVAAAKELFSVPREGKVVSRRHFFAVKQSAVDAEEVWEGETVRGTRGFFSVRKSHSSTTTISTRNLACFCAACLNHMYDECSSKAYVDPWKPRLVVAKSTGGSQAFVQGAEEEKEELFMSQPPLQAFEEGDNVAIKSEDGDGFYLCRVVQLFKADRPYVSDLRDVDGCPFIYQPGDHIIKVHYYHRVLKPRFYELWDETWGSRGTWNARSGFSKVWEGYPATYIHPGLVRHFKFTMTATKAKAGAGRYKQGFELSLEDLGAIRAAVGKN